MSEPKRHLYEFGPFRLNTEERCLVREGCFVPLTPKTFELLLVLVRKSGRVVEKDELMKELWPDSFVEEGNLTQQVFALRKALGENHREPHFIETVARRGYRFRAGVNQVREVESTLVLEPHTRTQIITEEKEDTASQDAVEAAGESVSVDLPPGSGRAAVEASAKAARDLASDVKRLERRWRVAAVVALTAATIVAATFVVRQHFSGASEAIDSLAVLPFVNTNADLNIEYLSDGLTESTINSLSHLTGLRVVSTKTMFRYKGKRIDPQAVARELGVRAVLTGEITKRDDTLIIRTELIDAARDAHLWGEQYNRKLSDILAVQEDISREISGKLRLRLTGDGQRLIKRHTTNAEAYQLYLKGCYFWNKRTEEGVRKGIDYLQQAIDADPLYALAYAGLADCYIVLGAPLNALPPKEAFLKAKAAATKALEIDDTLAEAHATLGVVKQRLEWDPEGAAQEFRRAIELNPTYATAHQWYAINFEIIGQPDAAIAETQRAYELDPLSIIINARLGHNYYYARRYDQAIEQYKKTLELDPNFVIAHSRLGWAYTQKGMHREAVEEFLRVNALSGESPETVATLKQVFARSGMRGYWRKALALEQEKAKHRYVSAYEIAVLYARLGENEQAFDWLEKAYQERSSALVYLKVDPSLDALRPDPRFTDLLRRIHLA
jgi:TolB-like protein/DNA-binding winged helix-turn-helix (wHTH) protein/Flp pilus assembly protein TadD